MYDRLRLRYPVVFSPSGCHSIITTSSTIPKIASTATGTLMQYQRYLMLSPGSRKPAPARIIWQELSWFLLRQRMT